MCPLIAWVGVLTVCVGYAAPAHAQDTRTKIDTTTTFDKSGVLELDIVAGNVRVTTWDRPSVHVVANATGSAAFDVDVTRSRMTLNAYTTGWIPLGDHVRMNKEGRVDCNITVPAGVRVRITSVAAPVTVSGVSGPIDISNVSGAVDLTNVSGNVNVDNVSGKIHVSGAPGEMHVTGVSGDITLDGVVGVLDVESVSGAIRMNNVRSTRVNVNNVSGSVSYDGWLDPEGRYDMESHSGWIAMTIAPKANAWVNVETLKGSVRNTYPQSVRQTEEPDDAATVYRYTLGKGGAKVNLETFSGKVQITSR